MRAIDIIKSEQIHELLVKGMREDARELMQMRSIGITPNFIPNAEGSAHVTLGNTKVLVGVKLDLAEPMPDTPDQGNLVVSAELLPMASPDFETGPPSPEAIELARVVDRGIRAAECIDLNSLFIEEGRVWGLYIDIYVLDHHGNLIDASELAAMSALLNTKVPEYKDGKIVREHKKHLKINQIVTATTFSKVADKLIYDPTIDEENSSSARLTMVTDNANIRAVQKGLSGSFTRQEAEQLAEFSLQRHKELRRLIEQSKS